MSITHKYNYLTADAAAVSRGGVLHGVVLHAGSGATGSVILYDNTAASGTKILSATAVQATSHSISNLDLVFGKGCFVDISGTGAGCTIIYR